MWPNSSLPSPAQISCSPKAHELTSLPDWGLGVSSRFGYEGAHRTPHGDVPWAFGPLFCASLPSSESLIRSRRDVGGLGDKVTVNSGNLSFPIPPLHHLHLNFGPNLFNAHQPPDAQYRMHRLPHHLVDHHAPKLAAAPPPPKVMKSSQSGASHDDVFSGGVPSSYPWATSGFAQTDTSPSHLIPSPRESHTQTKPSSHGSPRILYGAYEADRSHLASGPTKIWNRCVNVSEFGSSPWGTNAEKKSMKSPDGLDMAGFTTISPCAQVATPPSSNPLIVDESSTSASSGSWDTATSDKGASSSSIEVAHFGDRVEGNGEDQTNPFDETSGSVVFVGNIPPNVSKELVVELFASVLRSKSEESIDVDYRTPAVGKWNTALVTYSSPQLARCAFNRFNHQRGFTNTPFHRLACCVVSSQPTSSGMSSKIKGGASNSAPSSGGESSPRVAASRRMQPPRNSDHRFSSSFALLRDGPPGANLFVYGIPSDWHEITLMELAQEFGHIVGIRVPAAEMGGQRLNRGFGFVSYDNPLSALIARKELSEAKFLGKPLKVQFKTGEEHFGNQARYGESYWFGQGGRRRSAQLRGVEFSGYKQNEGISGSKAASIKSDRTGAPPSGTKARSRWDQRGPDIDIRWRKGRSSVRVRSTSLDGDRSTGGLRHVKTETHYSNGEGSESMYLTPREGVVSSTTASSFCDSSELFAAISPRVGEGSVALPNYKNSMSMENRHSVFVSEADRRALSPPPQGENQLQIVHVPQESSSKDQDLLEWLLPLGPLTTSHQYFTPQDERSTAANSPDQQHSKQQATRQETKDEVGDTLFFQPCNGSPHEDELSPSHGEFLSAYKSLFRAILRSDGTSSPAGEPNPLTFSHSQPHSTSTDGIMEPNHVDDLSTARETHLADLFGDVHHSSFHDTLFNSELQNLPHAQNHLRPSRLRTASNLSTKTGACRNYHQMPATATACLPSGNQGSFSTRVNSYNDEIRRKLMGEIDKAFPLFENSERQGKAKELAVEVQKSPHDFSLGDEMPPTRQRSLKVEQEACFLG
eukprot:GHVN01066412.1.p1 GENE.GHVN01066412.1~~GHVN01066412.1.p1  ORF type:complete len:1039 (-),score=127.03 GHVN01066412.1:4088-7204(-)